MLFNFHFGGKNMPIYEFYCGRCNMVFNFFSKSVNTEKIPACPKCDQPLQRLMSLFAKITRDKAESPGEEMPPFDEQKMENAMAMLGGRSGQHKRGRSPARRRL